MANSYQSWRSGPQLDNLYPIGSIYISTSSTNPGSLIGGTWEQIKDRFLLGAGSTYSAGATGGAATMAHTHNITHTHDVNVTSGGPSTNVSGGPSTNTSGSTTLTIAMMPNHAHTIRIWGDTNSNKAATIGADSGAFATRTAGARIYKDSSSAWVSSSPQSVANGYGDPAGNTVAAGGGASHTHTLSSHTHTLASHTHAITATSAGSSTATTAAASNTNNMPPYLVVYMWKRIS